MADKETVIAAMKCIVNLETVAVADCKKKGCVYAGKECLTLPTAKAGGFSVR